MKKIILTLFLLISYVASPEWEDCGYGLTNKVIRGLAVTGDTVFIGTNGAGVYFSTDFGNSWLPRNSGMEDDSISGVIVHGSLMFASSYNRYIYKSTNFGLTWVQINKGLTYNKVFNLATNGNNVYCGTNYEGLFRSTDYGETWEAVNNELASTPYIYILSICVNNDAIYIGIQPRNNPDDAGIFKSTDNCKSWYRITRNPSLLDAFLNSTAITCKDNKLIVATRFYGIYHSDDDGNNWTEMNNGLSISDGTFSFISLSSVDNDLFLGTLSSGVFWSPDNAENWFDLNFGTPFKAVRSVKQCGNYLFMATDSSIFRIELNKIAASISHNDAISAFSISPNPAMGYIEIAIPPLERGLGGVSPLVKLFDVLGVCVITSPPAPLHSGEGSKVRLDVSHLPPGVYFVQIGSRVQSFVKM